MILSHRFAKNIIVDLNFTEPLCIILKVDIIYSRPREGRVGILLAMFFKVDVCVKFEPKLFLKEISTAASVEGQICN